MGRCAPLRQDTASAETDVAGRRATSFETVCFSLDSDMLIEMRKRCRKQDVGELRRKLVLPTPEVRRTGNALGWPGLFTPALRAHAFIERVDGMVLAFSRPCRLCRATGWPRSPSPCCPPNAGQSAITWSHRFRLTRMDDGERLRQLELDDLLLSWSPLRSAGLRFRWLAPSAALCRPSSWRSARSPRPALAPPSNFWSISASAVRGRRSPRRFPRCGGRHLRRVWRGRD